MRRLPLPIRWQDPADRVQAEALRAAMEGLAEAQELALEDFAFVVPYDYNLQQRVARIQM